MLTNTQLLTGEFVNLVEYIAKNANLKNGKKRRRNESNNLVNEPSSEESTSNYKELSEILESDLVKLLDKYNIKEEFKVNLANLIGEVENYLIKNKNVNINYVKQLINKIISGSNESKSILYMLYRLKDNNMSTLNMNYTQELGRRILQNKHDIQSNSQIYKEDMPLNESVSSQLREMYYSPLPLDVSNDERVNKFETEKCEGEEYIDEKELVLDLIYLLKGMDCRYFKKINNKYFLINLNTTGSNRQIINKICKLGKMYHSIKEVKLEKNLVMEALYQGIIEELEDFTKLLELIILNHEDQNVNLLELYSLLQKPYRKIRLLYQLTSVSKVSINDVHEFSMRGDSTSREVFSRLMKKALVPYFEAIFKWVYSGELSSANMEFFVTREQMSKVNMNNRGTETSSNRDMGITNGALPDDEFYFNSDKVYEFFPVDLAKTIYEQGKLSHSLKRLKRSSKTRTLSAFMLGVCGDDWCIEDSVLCLRKLVSELNYSNELASVLLEGVGAYMSSLCCQFVQPEPEKYLKNIISSDTSSHRVYSGSNSTNNTYTNINANDNTDTNCAYMTEGLESGLRVYYARPTFPYKMVVDDYTVYNGMIRISALFKAAARGLNECQSEYLWLNRCNNRVLELSKVINKLNFYRAEMTNFLSAVQPFQNLSHFLDVYTSSLHDCRDLEDIRRCNRILTHHLNYKFYSQLHNILLNVIEFGNSMSELFKQDMRHLHSVDFRGSEKFIDFIDNELVDFAWSCTKSAELFRSNILRLLSKFKNLSLILDFNDYYKYNCKIN